jgi:hypothetical protein
MTFFAKAGANGGAFFLDDSAFIGYGLCSANVAYELLDCQM